MSQKPQHLPVAGRRPSDRHQAQAQPPGRRSTGSPDGAYEFIALVVLGAIWKLEIATVVGSTAIGWIAGYQKGANTVLRMIGMSARNAGPRPTTPPRKPADSKASVRPPDFGGRV